MSVAMILRGVRCILICFMGTIEQGIQWIDSCLRGIRYLTEPAFSNMASKGRAVAHKLHAVTQVRSCIGRPWWEKRTIKALGLGKLHQTVIQKNTTTINGTLRSVKHLLDIKPITIVSEELPKEQRNGDDGLFLRQNGQFHLRKFQKFLEDNPNMEEFIRKRKKQQIWQRRRPWIGSVCFASATDYLCRTYCCIVANTCCNVFTYFLGIFIFFLSGWCRWTEAFFLLRLPFKCTSLLWFDVYSVNCSIKFQLKLPLL